MKKIYVISVLVVGFSLGIFILPSFAAAQTISAQDAAVLNSQLEVMKTALINLQKQQETLALKNALDNLKNILESIKSKSQNQELSFENQKAINETLAGVKINLVAIDSNIKKKNSSTADRIIAKKKIASQPAVSPASSLPATSDAENQIVNQETQPIETNEPLTASIESAGAGKISVKKIIFGIIVLAILAILGYFAWIEKNYLTALFKTQKEKTMAFLKTCKEKIKEKMAMLWKIKEKSA